MSPRAAAASEALQAHCTWAIYCFSNEEDSHDALPPTGCIELSAGEQFRPNSLLEPPVKPFLREHLRPEVFSRLVRRRQQQEEQQAAAAAAEAAAAEGPAGAAAPAAGAAASRQWWQWASA